MKSFEEIVNEVYGWAGTSENSIKMEFKNCTESELIQYHHSLGRNIRNHFGLWNVEHTPEIVGGVDVSKDHPNAISFRVIQEVWRKMQDE